MIETLAFVLTGIGLTASIVYYANILNNANKTQKTQLETRQTQIFMQILDRFASEENRLRSIKVQQMEYKDFADFQLKWNMENNPEGAAKRLHVWTELDGLGQLYSRGLISLDFIPPIVHQIVVLQWEKWEYIINEQRKNNDDLRDRLVYFENIYNEIIKYRKDNPEITP